MLMTAELDNFDKNFLLHILYHICSKERSCILALKKQLLTSVQKRFGSIFTSVTLPALVSALDPRFGDLPMLPAALRTPWWCVGKDHCWCEGLAPSRRKWCTAAFSASHKGCDEVSPSSSSQPLWKSKIACFTSTSGSNTMVEVTTSLLCTVSTRQTSSLHCNHNLNTHTYTQSEPAALVEARNIYVPPRLVGLEQSDDIVNVDSCSLPMRMLAVVAALIAHGHVPAVCVLVMVDNFLRLAKDGHHPKTAFLCTGVRWGCALWCPMKAVFCWYSCHWAIITFSNGVNGLITYSDMTIIHTYTHTQTHTSLAAFAGTVTLTCTLA